MRESVRFPIAVSSLRVRFAGRKAALWAAGAAGLFLLLCVGMLLRSRFVRRDAVSDVLWNWNFREWTISKSAGGNADYKVTWINFGPVTLRTTRAWKPGDDRSLLDQ